MDEFARHVEAALFASASPLSPDEITAYVGDGDVAAALASLAERYAGHGVELVERGGGGISRPRPTSRISCGERARSRAACRARRPRR